jgi:hypothetical protein
MAYPEQYSPSTTDEIFYDNFETDIKGLDFREVAYPLPGRQLPKDLSKYAFTAVMPKETDIAKVRSDIGFPITYDFRISSGIMPAPTPRVLYMDTGLAIGLVHKDFVIGIAGASLDNTNPRSRLTVKQIQSWGVKPESRDAYKDSGLHGGFLWRHTMVRAWAQLAINNGIQEIAIQGASNNSSAHPSGPSFPRFLNRYDQVAQDLGFKLELSSGNFIYPVFS